MRAFRLASPRVCLASGDLPSVAFCSQVANSHRRGADAYANGRVSSRERDMPEQKFIEIRGAREHNLKVDRRRHSRATGWW